MADVLNSLAGQALGAEPELWPLLPPRFALWAGLSRADLAGSDAEGNLFAPALIPPGHPALDVSLPSFQQMAALRVVPEPASLPVEIAGVQQAAPDGLFEPLPASIQIQPTPAVLVSAPVQRSEDASLAALTPAEQLPGPGESQAQPLEPRFAALKKTGPQPAHAESSGEISAGPFVPAAQFFEPDEGQAQSMEARLEPLLGQPEFYQLAPAEEGINFNTGRIESAGTPRLGPFQAASIPTAPVPEQAGRPGFNNDQLAEPDESAGAPSVWQPDEDQSQITPDKSARASLIWHPDEGQITLDQSARHSETVASQVAADKSMHAPFALLSDEVQTPIATDKSVWHPGTTEGQMIPGKPVRASLVSRRDEVESQAEADKSTPAPFVVEPAEIQHLATPERSARAPSLLSLAAADRSQPPLVMPTKSEPVTELVESLEKQSAPVDMQPAVTARQHDAIETHVEPVNMWLPARLPQLNASKDLVEFNMSPEPQSEPAAGRVLPVDSDQPVFFSAAGSSQPGQSRVGLVKARRAPASQGHAIPRPHSASMSQLPEVKQGDEPATGSFISTAFQNEPVKSQLEPVPGRGQPIELSEDQRAKLADHNELPGRQPESFERQPSALFSEPVLRPAVPVKASFVPGDKPAVLSFRPGQNHPEQSPHRLSLPVPPTVSAAAPRPANAIQRQALPGDHPTTAVMASQLIWPAFNRTRQSFNEVAPASSPDPLEPALSPDRIMPGGREPTVVPLPESASGMRPMAAEAKEKQPSRSLRQALAQPIPTIRVSIGRVVVRAALESEPSRSRPAEAPRLSLSLSDYLKGSQGDEP